MIQHSEGRSVRRVPLVIAAGGTVNGSIQTCGDVYVRGTVRGDIVLGYGCLFVEDGACVTGDIFADGIRVAGRVLGMCAADHVQILPTGEIRGMTHAATLTIEQGGRLLGRSCLRAVQAGFRFAARLAPHEPVDVRPPVILARSTRGETHRHCLALRLLGLVVVGGGLLCVPALLHTASSHAPAALPVALESVARPQVIAPVRALAPADVVARRVPAAAVPAKPAATAAAQSGRMQSGPVAARNRLAVLPPAEAPSLSPAVPVAKSAVGSMNAAAGEVAWLNALAGLQSNMLNHAIMQSTRAKTSVAGRARDQAVVTLADNLMATRKWLRMLGGSRAVTPYVFSVQVRTQSETAALQQQLEELRAQAGQIGVHAQSKHLLDVAAGLMRSIGRD